MEVKDIARDAVYAAIGFTTLTAQQVAEQARKAYAAFESSLTATQASRKETIDNLVSTFESTQASSKESFEKLVATAKERFDEVSTEVGKLNGNVVETIEAQVPEQVRTTLTQLRSQVTEIAEQVVENGRKLVQRAA